MNGRSCFPSNLLVQGGAYVGTRLLLVLLVYTGFLVRSYGLDVDFRPLILFIFCFSSAHMVYMWVLIHPDGLFIWLTWDLSWPFSPLIWFVFSFIHLVYISVFSTLIWFILIGFSVRSHGLDVGCSPLIRFVFLCSVHSSVFNLGL